MSDTPRTDTYYSDREPVDDERLGARDAAVRGRDRGGGADLQRRGNSRFSVDVRSLFPQAVGKGFGALVESVDAEPVPIVVEWAGYSDAPGVFWAAGANALATILK